MSYIYIDVMVMALMEVVMGISKSCVASPWFKFLVIIFTVIRHHLPYFVPVFALISASCQPWIIGMILPNNKRCQTPKICLLNPVKGKKIRLCLHNLEDEWRCAFGRNSRGNCWSLLLIVGSLRFFCRVPNWRGTYSPERAAGIGEGCKLSCLPRS